MGQRLTKKDIRLLQEERKINAINYINNVTKEKNELESRINKAIDYLKSEDFWLSQVKANDELLDILKGSDKE